MSKDSITEYTHNVYMTFDDWDGINNYRKKMYFDKLRQERIKRANYYKRQRAFGMVIMCIAIVLLIVGLITKFAILQGASGMIALIGLYTMLTRQMILVDDYYLECMDKINLF